jgi:hypothetical protein
MNIGWDALDSGGGYIGTRSVFVQNPASIARIIGTNYSFAGDIKGKPGLYFENMAPGANFTVRVWLPQFTEGALYDIRATDVGTIDLTGLTGGGLPQIGELFAVVLPMDWNTAPAGAVESAPYPSCFDAQSPTPDVCSLFWDQGGGGEDYRRDDDTGNITVSVSATATMRTPYTRGGAWDAAGIYQIRDAAQVATTTTDGTYPDVTAAALGISSYSYIAVCGFQGAVLTSDQRSVLAIALRGAVETAVNRAAML